MSLKVRRGASLVWVGMEARGGQACAGKGTFWIPAVEMSNRWGLEQNRSITDAVLSFPFPCLRAMYLFVMKV